jgi:hypothetical protein
MENIILKNNSETSSELTNEQLVAMLKSRVERGEISQQDLVGEETKSKEIEQTNSIKFNIKSLYMYIASGLVYVGLMFIVGINWISLSEVSRLSLTLGTGLFLLIFCNLISLKKISEETKALVGPILGISLIVSAIIYYIGLNVYISSAIAQTIAVEPILAYLVGSMIFSAVCLIFNSLKANKQNGVLFLITIIAAQSSFVFAVIYVLKDSSWYSDFRNVTRSFLWSNLVYGVFVFGLVFKNWRRLIARFVNIINSAWVMLMAAVSISAEASFNSTAPDITKNLIEFLYLPVIAIFFLYAKKIDSIVLAIVTGVASFIWMFYINVRYFSNNTTFAIVLVVCGIAGIVFGIVQTVRQNQKTAKKIS